MFNHIPFFETFSLWKPIVLGLGFTALMLMAIRFSRGKVLGRKNRRKYRNEYGMWWSLVSFFKGLDKDAEERGRCDDYEDDAADDAYLGRTNGAIAGAVTVSLVSGVLVALFDVLLMKLTAGTTGFAFVTMAFCLGMTIAMIVWPYKWEHVGYADTLVFIGMYGLLFLLNVAASRKAWAGLPDSEGWHPIILYAPAVIFLTAMVIRVMALFHVEAILTDGWMSNTYKVLKWVSPLIAAVILVWQIILPSIDWWSFSPSSGRSVSAESSAAEQQQPQQQQQPQSASVEAATTSSIMLVPASGAVSDKTGAQIILNQPVKVGASPFKWHYYHYDVLTDGIADNDYNFGPDPRKLHPRLETGFDYLLDVIDRVNSDDESASTNSGPDPTLGVAIVAEFDNVFGTNYLGIKGREMTDALLNERVDYYRNNPDAYRSVIQDWVINVANSIELGLCKLELREFTNELVSQMYQVNGADGLPDLVMAENPNRGGLALVFCMDSKELILRIECGYQPCNLRATPVWRYEETPQPYNPPTQPATEPTSEEPTSEEPTSEEPTSEEPTSEEPTSEEPTSEEPTSEEPTSEEPTSEEPTSEEPTSEEPTSEEPTSEEPTSEEPTSEEPTKPEPETDPYDKDPEKATAENEEPNDDAGIEGDKDTNTGEGSTQSAAELPNNRDQKTYEEYTKAVEELETINQEQKVGGDDNTPSYIPPVVVDDQGETEPLIQDNNGDTGNVGAPALDTPVAEAPVQTINGGQEIANNDTNNPDDPAWGNSEDPDWQIE